MNMEFIKLGFFHKLINLVPVSRRKFYSTTGLGRVCIWLKSIVLIIFYHNTLFDVRIALIVMFKVRTIKNIGSSLPSRCGRVGQSARKNHFDTSYEKYIVNHTVFSDIWTLVHVDLWISGSSDKWDFGQVDRRASVPDIHQKTHMYKYPCVLLWRY